MTVSELIAKLNTILQTEGDVPVMKIDGINLVDLDCVEFLEPEVEYCDACDLPHKFVEVG